MPDRLFRVITAFLLFTGWLGGGAELAAQQPHWMGFRGDLGMEVPLGSAGELFQGNIRGEFSLLFQPRPFPPFYFGLGAGWVTFHLDPRFTGICEGQEEEQDPDAPSCEAWNQVGLHLFVGAYLDRWLPLPLYVEARLIERRLRPMHYRYWKIDSENYIKETPYPEYTGFGLEGVVGLRKALTRGGTFIDLAVRGGQFKPVGVEFEPPFEHLPGVPDGWALGLQVGLVWFP